MQVGWIAPIKVMLYILRQTAPQLLQADFEGALNILRDAGAYAPLDVMARANSYALSSEDLTIVNQVYV